MINEKFLVRVLEEIYAACNEERVFQIQNRIGDLIKELKSSKPSLNNRTIQSATFDNPEVEKSFQRLKAIIKKEKIDVMKLFTN